MKVNLELIDADTIKECHTVKVLPKHLRCNGGIIQSDLTELPGRSFRVWIILLDGLYFLTIGSWIRRL